MNEREDMIDKLKAREEELRKKYWDLFYAARRVNDRWLKGQYRRKALEIERMHHLICERLAEYGIEACMVPQEKERAV